MEHILKRDKAEYLTEEIFKLSGFKEEYALRLADNLVLSESRGIRSHGLVQVEPYVENLKNARMTNETPSITSEFGSVSVLDGKLVPGAVSAHIAMDIATDKAAENGIGLCAVKNGTHFGMAYDFARQALEKDMIGLVFTNTLPVAAPYGGISAQLGTNPICIAVPSNEDFPLVFDAATTVQAQNKIYFASVEKQKIPIDWALDENGHNTDDPDKALNGALLPFGGYKGYGLMFMVNILTGILSGSSVIKDINGELSEDINAIGFNLCAIDVTKLSDVNDFKSLVSIYAKRIRGSKKSHESDRIYLPGEKEQLNYIASTKNGLVLYDGVYKSLKRLAKEYEIDDDF